MNDPQQFSDPQREMIATIVRVLRPCKSILFVTGAGLSADSGLPTYRGIGGMYEVEDTEDGYAIEEVLSGEMLRRNPELTWKYLAQIADAARGATYNRGHKVIAEMEQALPRVWTLTQNVDGFHRMAGSKNVIEIHGNMRSLTCMECGKTRQVTDGEELEIPPRCARDKCAGIMRPDVVLFSENLPVSALTTLQQEAERGFGAVVNVGTSGLFPYIQEPTILAKRFGIPTVEINPGETVLSSHVDYRLPLGAAAALHAIWDELVE